MRTMLAFKAVLAHTAVLALAVVVLTLAAPAWSAQSFPSTGVLTPGVSLGGVKLGFTAQQVIGRWGSTYSVCSKSQCGHSTVWYFVYQSGEPLGAAVRFDKAGKVTAVFTLGSPTGWRTADGLLIGQGISDAQRLYGSNLSWSVCLGYGAMSMKGGKAVTSIYTYGETVYGFALTSPGTPVCQ
jgi:hypothetical protein